MGRSRQKKTKLHRCRKNQPPPESVPPTGATEISDGGPTRFFGCYLLTSLSPRYKGHSYIGFTVNPKRRIRQHNGEITSGASKTKRKRPWEMVFCIHGFPSQVAALQFEWAWQHPKESLAVRETASTFKTLGGLANKIKLSLTMLTLPSWNSMDLTVSFFSTKYMNHTAGCPTLPRQMKIHFCSMDELPCYWHGDNPYACDDEDDINSNHTEDFDTEEILSQVAIESIHEVDNFEKESSSSHPFDQFDPSCQKESPSPRHFHAGILSKETWIEEQQRDPSPDLTERSNRDSFHTEEISSPVLIESIYSFEKESSSSHLFDQNDPSCEKELPSHCVLEEDIDIVIDKSAKKEDITYARLPVRVRADVWPSSMEGIEIIDLFTPSPECRLVSGTKKRRVIRDSTDIIDLTRSPLFVQL